MLETDTEGMESLVDTLAEKATGTIRIRALDFSKYLLWAQNLGVDHDSVTESAAYQYMVHLRNSGAAKTTLQRFLESAAFAKHILGWNIEDEVLCSRRLKGAAFRSLRDLPPVRRSQPFPPGFIAYLERIVVGPLTSAELRVLAGHVLFLVHTRARYADAQRVQVEPSIANGWLCTRTNEYKTSKAKNRRGRSLPLLGLASGYEHAWAQPYLEARRALQICAGRDRPFLPAVVNGTVQPHSWSMPDAVAFIRHHLAKASEAGDIPVVQVDSFATHSCKRTLLHWAAVAGEDLDTRRLLGHHTVQADGAWLAYSAEALHGPMKRLAVVMHQVRRNQLPVMFRMQPEAEVPESTHETIASKASGTDTLSDSDQSSSDSS
eukprot:4647548-Amphidinium_carterae.1